MLSRAAFIRLWRSTALWRMIQAHKRKRYERTRKAWRKKHPTIIVNNDPGIRGLKSKVSTPKGRKS